VFNLSGSEIIVILVLALVVLGPEKLPEAMRKAGRTWAELRKMSTSFQDEVRKGFDEPAREVRKTANAVRSAASFTSAASPADRAEKPQYNPETDPPPEMPPGNAVAEDSADATEVADPAPDPNSAS
jgi:sec-independent protein translocase protein TatB